MTRAAAVIVAAGRGERLGGEGPKQFAPLGGHAMLLWSVSAFRTHPDVETVVVVLPPAFAASPPAWLPDTVTVVAGGETRAASVACGLAATSPDADPILVHDAARPFPSADLISRVAGSAAADPTVPVLPLADTIKSVDEEGNVIRTPARSGLRRVQTPQGFPADLLRWAHAAAGQAASITDDATALERAGCAVRTIPGEPHNLKITDPLDLAYARWLVETGVIPMPTFE